MGSQDQRKDFIEWKRVAYLQEGEKGTAGEQVENKSENRIHDSRPQKT